MMTEAERALLLAMAEGVAIVLGKSVIEQSGPPNLIVLGMSNKIRDLARKVKDGGGA